MVFRPSLPRTVPSPSYCFGKGRFFFARFPALPRIHINKKTICGRRGIRTSFCPVVVEDNFAAHLGVVEHTEQQQISAIHRSRLTTFGTLSPAIWYSSGFLGQQMTMPSAAEFE
jgi:hypothetical protein